MGLFSCSVIKKTEKKKQKLGSATRWNRICRSNYRSDSGTARPAMHPEQLISFTVIVKTPRLAFISTPPVNLQPHKGRWNCLLEHSGEEIIIKDQREVTAPLPHWPSFETHEVPDWIPESGSNQLQILVAFYF